MTILVIANNSSGLYDFRGMLLRELIDLGNEITVFTPYDTRIQELKELGIKLVEMPIDRRGTNPLKDIKLIKCYIRELKGIKPNLVITYTIKPNVYGGLASCILKIPYVANITGLGTAFEGSGVLRKVATILNKIALRKAKVVFFENTEDRNVFVDAGIVAKEKTHVLHGAGVDLNHFSYQPYPKNQDFHFLFIGRVMKEKGVDELLQSMKRLVNEGIQCSLDILGYYEEDYKGKLDEAVKAGWLRYHGNQPDVRPFIAACDCFVLPSYHEGMANTNLECAASGRPIITSNIHGCMEAVIEGSGLLCEPKNNESLYEAMKAMIEKTKEEREQMGLVGRKYMEDVFDKRKVVEETIEVLTKN